MKWTVNEEVSQEMCTGCGACVNICPVSAIVMSEDKEGFLYPELVEDMCVECGKCIQGCPVLHYENTNMEKPKIFAVRADDDIRAVSSSGGVFHVLAEMVLKNHGVVCGAAFDKNMVLQHVLIEKTEELEKLRGSKYLQSNVKQVYREIKKILKTGRQVLFTGTPCQNAALKSVLGKEYDNLLLVDIICHGVPSQKIFTQYLREVSKGKEITSVNFRSKLFGWQSGKVLIHFSDGTEYVGSVNDDPYEVGFYRNLFLQSACSECRFSEYPREGDLSLGDFWGISEIDTGQNDGKGTSMVLVNNAKGEMAFAQVKETFYQVKEYPFEDLHGKIKNRVKAHYPANKKRTEFFKTFQREKNLYQSVKMTLPESLREKEENIIKRKYQIGLVSNYLAVNFGGSLTQLALYHVLKQMGYTVGMIERPRTAKGRVGRETLAKMYKECPYDEKDLLPRFADKKEMEQLNQICGQFVVGSDQLYQYTLYQELDKFVSLSWVKDRKKKIAYAGSFGHGKIWGDTNEIAEMGYFLQKYDAFSVREQDAVQLCKRHFDVNAEWVLDPVFLCDKQVYFNLAEKAEREKAPHYIASYILDPSEDKQKILKTVMKEQNLPVEIYSEMVHSKEYTEPLGDLNVVYLKVEERLDSIIHCDYFVTDSFHGTCFAIIMGKPFISILNTKRGGSRFTSLLEVFGLQERLVKDSRDLENNIHIITKSIDYESVNTILDREKKRCLQWLKNSLKAPKKNIYSDYDMMKKLLKEQQQTIDVLRQDLLSLAKLVEKEGRFIENVYDYVDYLCRVQKDYVILIAVKDTLGLAVNSQIADKLNELGIKNKLVGKHGRSFAAILDGGENIYEELGVGTEPIETELRIDNKDIKLISRVYKNGNEARIEYNKKDYAVNQRGLNIVLISKRNGRVEDSVCFDMHVMEYRCYRNPDVI